MALTIGNIVASRSGSDATKTAGKSVFAGVKASTSGAGAKTSPKPPIPPAPPIPPKPTSGDGAGAFNSKSPSLGDRATEQVFHRVAAFADASGFDNAAGNMRHFLAGSGDTRAVDPQSMLNDLPGFQTAANDQFNHDVIGAINDKIGKEWNGKPMSFTINTGWQSHYAGKSDSADWYYGMGGFSFSQTASVSVVPGSDGRPVVEIDSKLHVFDRYNWDAGKAVTIGPFVVKDEQLGSLHEAGLAQEFLIAGSSAARRTDYIYKGATSTTLPNTETPEGWRDSPIIDSPRETGDYTRP